MAKSAKKKIFPFPLTERSFFSTGRALDLSKCIFKGQNNLPANMPNYGKSHAYCVLVSNILHIPVYDVSRYQRLVKEP